MIAKCEKWKVYSVLFCVTFSHFGLLFFSFHSILRWGWHSHKNSKDFVVYFFAALIKREIRMKCKKCMVSVLYFMMCFAKIFAKCRRNTKYEKCIAGLSENAFMLTTWLSNNEWTTDINREQPNNTHTVFLTRSECEYSSEGDDRTYGKTVYVLWFIFQIDNCPRIISGYLYSTQD